MVKIDQLVSYLKAQQSTLSTPQVTLMNFLSHQYSGKVLLTTDIFEEFLSHALRFSYWQENRESLIRELDHLLDRWPHSHELGFRQDNGHWFQPLQVFEIEREKDWKDICQLYLKNHHRSAKKIVTALEGPQILFGFVIEGDNSVYIYSFDRTMTIRHGYTEPAKTQSYVQLREDFELVESLSFNWTMDTQSHAIFSIKNGKVQGRVVRGPFCNLLIEMDQVELRQAPSLFYSLKRAEQFLVDRRTDPLYQHFIRSIEKFKEICKFGQPQVLQDAYELLAHTETALEHIYKQDRLLTLLKADLQRALESNPAPAVNQPKASPKAETRVWQPKAPLDLTN